MANPPASWCGLCSETRRTQEEAFLGSGGWTPAELSPGGARRELGSVRRAGRHRLGPARELELVDPLSTIHNQKLLGIDSLRFTK